MLVGKKPKNHEIAEELINSSVYKKNLVYHTGYDLFYLYQDEEKDDSGWYLPLNEHGMQRTIRKFLIQYYSELNINMALIKDIVNQIKLGIVRQIDEEQYNYICLTDKLLNLDTFEPEPHTRNQVVLHHLPYSYDQLSNSTPVWDKFLASTFVDRETLSITDSGMINLVREMIGFFLLGDLYGGTAFFLTGNGANGKSILTGVLENIMGDEFSSTMSIQTLTTDKFATAHLIGKKINISNEEESKFIKSDKFKALITGNKVDGERKFGEKFEFIPHTKYVFATNSLPTFDGLDYGLRRRIIIIPFFQRFVGENRDVYLDKKLKEEIPGIIGWAIEGAKKLKNNKYIFTEVDAAKEVMEDFENDISSTVRFIRENYIVDNESFISNQSLYDNYKGWCEACGKKHVNMFKFIKDIINTIDGTSNIRGKDYNNKRVSGKNLKLLLVSDEDIAEDKLKEINF